MDSGRRRSIELGRRRVWTVEIGRWRVSCRRATLDLARWDLLRDGATAFALYMPFIVVTAFGRSR